MASDNTSDNKKESVINTTLVKAKNSGISGASAMVVQVTTLMWMRTTMNYQYRNGGTIKDALKTLYKEGGLVRFYRGYTPALFQGPLSRFGDTAANVGVIEFMKRNETTKQLPIAIQTFCASFTAAIWRIFLMPIDATKTSLQVHGKEGFRKLLLKTNKSPTVLYHGSMAAWSATLIGHYPWFFTFNTLDEKLPLWDSSIWTKLGRRAFMGFCSSVVSDTISNSIRVLKTYRQTSPEPISYPNCVRKVVAESGVGGLFGRGLKIRILANGTQGLLFAVMWKGFMDLMEGGNAKGKRI